MSNEQSQNCKILVHNGRAGKITFAIFLMCIFSAASALAPHLHMPKNQTTPGLLLTMAGQEKSLLFLFDMCRFSPASAIAAHLDKPRQQTIPAFVFTMAGQ